MIRATVSLLLIFLISALAVYSISFVLPALAQIYGDGIYLTIPASWIGGAIGGLLLSILADKWSRKLSLLISIFLFTVPLFLNVFTRNLFLFYFLWFLIGFGVNGENGLSYVYAAEISPPSYRGFVGSIMQGLYFIGGLLGLLWADIFRSIETYFLTLGLLSLVSYLLWFSIPESKVRSRGSFSSLRSKNLTKVLVLGSVFAVGSFLFVVPLVSLSFTLFSFFRLPAFSLLSLALLLGLIGFSLAGRLSDRWGRKRTTFIFIVISLVSSVMMLLQVPTSLIGVLVTLLMVGSSFFAYFGVWMSEVFPPEVRATGTNIVFFLGRLIGGGFGVSIILLMPFGLKEDLGVGLLTSTLLVLGSVLLLPETVRRG
ncbi:MFS transporter [Metallosphaera tengchongensis]|uniref:MFS transporter n=1 Tax=Metallosphaera tengchongensis TaxID=1532350 RepID=A0A6N0NQH7_9CREN|nr:MFS transporter [Metallosphaera tengchongensis]QKQ99123.1 MFS transporter [Metallosphaera tengchongensis]